MRLLRYMNEIHLDKRRNLREELGRRYTHPPEYLSRSLTFPSIQALDTLQLSILQRQGSIIALHGLYRVVQILGSGSYGTVLGMAMRTGELDMSILDVLHTNVDKDESHTLNVLRDLFSRIPKALAVKISEYRDVSVNEFLIGRQLATWTIGRGYRCIPAYYSLYEYKEVRRARYREDEDTELILVLGRDLGTEPVGYYLYQEFLTGTTLGNLFNNNVLSIQQANATMCYLHGMLSYLYKQIGFVHCDLHKQNILMVPISPGTPLPIVDEDGIPITYVQLDYQPVFIDFGVSKTRTLSKTTRSSFYNTSQIQDIIFLNHKEDLSGTVKPSNLVSYKVAKELLVDDFDMDGTVYTPPFLEFIAEGKLTHAHIVREMLSSDVIDSIKSDPPSPVISSGLGLYTGRDDTSRDDILRRIEQVSNAYKSLPSSRFTLTVSKYLEETYDCYHD